MTIPWQGVLRRAETGAKCRTGRVAGLAGEQVSLPRGSRGREQFLVS